MRVNQTILIFSILWVASITYTFMYNNLLFLWIPYIVFLVNELIYISFAIDIFPASDRTEIFYDLSSLPTTYDPKTGSEIDPNYSEGYYPGEDYNITPRQAENNKFDKILELLGAKPGDKILDMGCGVCSFEVYCKSKGIEMTGLTVSSEQEKICNEDLKVKAKRWDYRVFNPEFEKKFDHIVWMGSLEHIYAGPHHFMKSYEKKKTVIKDILEIVKRYYKDGATKRIFVSTLHVNPTFTKTKEMFVLERTYGGQFLLNQSGYDIMSIGKEAGFELLYTRDSTKDYYMPTVLDEYHFGNPCAFISKSALALAVLGLIYPFAWYMLYYNSTGVWMWMFDGNHHYLHNKKYSLKPMKERPITLWWCVLQA